MKISRRQLRQAIKESINEADSSSVDAIISDIAPSVKDLSRAELELLDMKIEDLIAQLSEGSTMKITKSQLRRIIKEAQWGNFTGGSAPLDEPPLDSGKMAPDQQQKVFNILVDTGSDPKKLLASGEFPDVVTEVRLNERGTGNPELQAEERALVSAVVSWVDKYRLVMGIDPSSPVDSKRVKMTLDDIIGSLIE